MKQTVLQKAIEELEGVADRNSFDESYLSGILKAQQVLRDLLPVSEQELKDAYETGRNHEYKYHNEAGFHPDADDWFRNEFGEG